MRWTLGSNAVGLAAALMSAVASTHALAQSTNSPSDVHRLGRAVANQSLPTPQREQDASRLVDEHNQAARAILLNILNNAGDPTAQIAVAHAIAVEQNPDRLFVNPLRSLLGSSRALTEAAALALVNYRDNPDSFPQLQSVASNPALSDGVRTAAIGAMGELIDKRVATYLMQLFDDPSQTVTIQNAAAHALGEMTGLPGNGVDHQRWHQWWALNQNTSQDQWRTDLLYNRTREFQQAKQQYTQLSDGLHSAIRGSYELVPEAQKNTALLKFLGSDEPQVRAIGAELVDDDFAAARRIVDSIKQRLRAMLSDPDRRVRAAVVNTIFDINDRGAVPAVIAQLRQEPDPEIRQKLAESLGRMDDLSAAAVLLKMLDNPDFEDATAAAKALGELGARLHSDNPVLAGQVFDALNHEMDERGSDPGAGQLKSACLAAMAAMRDPRAMHLFLNLLRPNESDAIHIAALGGLGDLGDPNAAGAIANSLTDPSPAVRLEAARALKNVATFAQAEQLYSMLDPNQEPDPEVRSAVWQTLKTVLGTGSVQQLNGWPDRFKNDPDKRLAALLDLRDALSKQHNALQLAYTDQNIGQTLMNITPPRPDDAATAFQKALDYWRGPGANQAGGATALDELVGQLLKALLTAHHYAGAAAFAAKQIAVNDQYQEIVGPILRDQADRLHSAGQDASAKILIDDALKMSPPLDARYQDGLKQVQSELKP